MNADEKLKQVLKGHTEELMALSGVVGIAIGETEEHAPCLLVMVSKVTAELRELIPSALEGYPVRLLESGDIKPL